MSDAALGSPGVGIRRVGDAIKRARGTMPQKVAAKTWGVPLATMAALEQGIERNYQPHTLAQFDQVLGQSTLDLYLRPDGEQMRTIEEKVTDLTSKVDALLAAERPPPVEAELDALMIRLTPAQRELVLALVRELAGS